MKSIIIVGLALAGLLLIADESKAQRIVVRGRGNNVTVANGGGLQANAFAGVNRGGFNGFRGVQANAGFRGNNVAFASAHVGGFNRSFHGNNFAVVNGVNRNFGHVNNFAFNRSFGYGVNRSFGYGGVAFAPSYGSYASFAYSAPLAYAAPVATYSYGYAAPPPVIVEEEVAVPVITYDYRRVQRAVYGAQYGNFCH